MKLTTAKWRGGYRWFRSPNVIKLEDYPDDEALYRLYKYRCVSASKMSDIVQLRRRKVPQRSDLVLPLHVQLDQLLHGRDQADVAEAMIDWLEAHYTKAQLTKVLQLKRRGARPKALRLAKDIAARA